MVRDDSLRCAGTLKDSLAVEQVCKSGSINVLSGLVVVHQLCIPIDNDENGIIYVSMSSIQWQVHDEVHGDITKTPSGRGSDCSSPWGLCHIILMCWHMSQEVT